MSGAVQDRAGRSAAAPVLAAAMLGIGLLYLVGAAGTWAVHLPGVTTSFQHAQSVGGTVTVVGCCAALAVGIGWVLTGRLGSGLTAARVGARALVDALGLALTPRRATIFATVGIAGAVLSYATVVAITTWVTFPAPTGPDLRWNAVAQAPTWAAGLYYAVAAAPVEELGFRGALLVGALAAQQMIPGRLTRQTAIALLLVATSVTFGWMHLHYSVTNAATAAAAGFVFGGLALRYKSLWPAVIAHGGYNYLAIAL